tara:strand:+ start:6455 stop:8257 length:1803 start_codon:yes stop_codon:yes gene_type:complete
MTQSQFIQQLKQQSCLGAKPDPTGGAFDNIKSVAKATAAAFKAAAEAAAVLGPDIGTATAALMDFNDANTNLLTGLEKNMAAQQTMGNAFLKSAQRSLVLEKRNKELNKTFGINSENAQKMAAALNQNAEELGISGKQAIKYATNLKKVVPVMATFTKKLDKGQGVQSNFFLQLTAIQDVITTNMGLGAEAAESFTYYAAQQDTAGKKNAMNMGRVLKATQNVAELIEKKTGMQGVFKDITEGVAKASAETQLQFGRIPGNLELAVLKGKALGFSLDELTGIGKNLLDIESSIGAELEYQLLSGRRLVGSEQAKADLQGKSLTNAFREAALKGDAEQQADALNAILQQEGDVLENNLMARQQMSKLLGIDESKLARAIQKKKLLEESGAEVLMELSGGDFERAARDMMKAGDMDAEAFKTLMELEDQRTTDDILKESLDVQLDLNAKAQLQNQLLLADKGNRETLKAELEKQISGMGTMKESDMKSLGFAIRQYEVGTGALGTAREAGLSSQYDTALKAATTVEDSLIIPGVSTQTGGFGEMYRAPKFDAIATGPPEALQAAANGGGGMDVTAFAAAIVSAMKGASFAVDPGPVAYKMGG